MVRDGYYYGLASVLAAVLLGWLTSPAWAVLPLLLGAFFLNFFRDPERRIPDTPGAIVAPADGKVTDIVDVEVAGRPYKRLSIFLNVFDVHVNRSPVEGVITAVEYRKGQFKNAMGSTCVDHNEQNIVTLDTGAHTLIFKQIAGLLARRIVFTRKVGDRVARGERIGMMKFGSRMDVIFDPSATVNVKLGQHVKGGSDILAIGSPVTRPANRPAQERVRA
jgi:phosphatidylserine decarboxylase